MPLVPLYDENVSPDASHNVRAPGGYETWRLWSYGAQLDVVSVTSIWNGYPHDPQYIKAYRRYCKSPTETTPPLPGDYACQEIACFGAGVGTLTRVLERIEKIHAFPNLGPTGVRISSGETLKPLSSPPLSLTTRSASHHWDLRNPLVLVSSEIEGLRGEILGFCDHRYGDSPLNSDYFLDGCVFFPSRMFAFQATQTTSWIVHLTTTTTKLVDQPLDFSPRKTSLWRDPTPKRIALGEHAMLTNPTPISSQPSRRRVMYDAKSVDERGRAFCEVNAPIMRPFVDLFAHRPSPCHRPLTWAPLPPADKSSPSAP